MSYYSDREQEKHHRAADRDRGCRCPSGLMPGTHLLDCPLPKEAQEDYLEMLDQEHDADAGHKWISIPRKLRSDLDRELQQEQRAINSLDGIVRRRWPEEEEEE
jgi:hypothetical protein